MIYNPTENIDISFENYVENRNNKFSAHLQGGIPDYAFASDYQIRQKIKATPGVYPFFKAVTNTIVPRELQKINMSSLKVSNRQYSHIYDMTVECSNKLGIGIPTVFIQPSVDVFNAYTVATDDISPIIIINSALLDRMTDDELKVIIAHECGHIHNNHGIYNYAAEKIINAGANAPIPYLSQILSSLSFPIQLMFLSWSRAAEVTCDRAGVICSNNQIDAQNTFAKMTHLMLNAGDVNLEEAIKQYDRIKKTNTKYYELFNTHPLSVKRILACREFLESECLYTWRPEWKDPDKKLYDKKEIDLRCNEFISVAKGGVKK